MAMACTTTPHQFSEPSCSRPRPSSCPPIMSTPYPHSHPATFCRATPSLIRSRTEAARLHGPNSEEGKEWAAYLRYKFEKRDEDEDEDEDREEDYAFGGSKSRSGLYRDVSLEERRRRMQRVALTEVGDWEQRTKPHTSTSKKISRSMSASSSASSHPSSSYTDSYSYSHYSAASSPPTSYTPSLLSSPIPRRTISLSSPPAHEYSDAEENYLRSAFSDDEDDDDVSSVSSTSSSVSSSRSPSRTSAAKKELQRLHLRLIFGIHRFKKSITHM